MMTWFIDRRSKINWAREQAIPEIEQLHNEINYAAAYRIALKAEEYIPDDPKLVKLLSDISQYSQLANFIVQGDGNLEAKNKFIKISREKC